MATGDAGEQAPVQDGEGRHPNKDVAEKPVRKAPPGASPDVGVYTELKSRFIKAMESILTSPADAWDEGGLIGLLYLEQDFGVQANANELIQKVVSSGASLPQLVRQEPRGLKASRLVEQKPSMAWLRKHVNKKMPFMPSDKLLLLSFVQQAVATCLKEEALYNQKFLRHMRGADWPDDSEWILYGLNAGFVMHSCVSPDFALENTRHLERPLVRMLEAGEVKLGLKSYVLFGLAVSGRLSSVPNDTVFSFVRAQLPDGSWSGGDFNFAPQNQTAIGAYIIAKMLVSAGHDLPRTDFRYASLLPGREYSVAPAKGGGTR